MSPGEGALPRQRLQFWSWEEILTGKNGLWALGSSCEGNMIDSCPWFLNLGVH